MQTHVLGSTSFWSGICKDTMLCEIADAEDFLQQDLGTQTSNNEGSHEYFN